MTRMRTAFLSVACLIFATAAAATEPRRVLRLHAFGHAYSPWSDMTANFREEPVKNSPAPRGLYEVSLDTAGIQDPSDEWRFVEYIRAILSGRKFELIVPVGALAVFFVQRHRRYISNHAHVDVGSGRATHFECPRTAIDAAILLDLDQRSLLFDQAGGIGNGAFDLRRTR